MCLEGVGVCCIEPFRLRLQITALLTPSSPFLPFNSHFLDYVHMFAAKRLAHMFFVVARDSNIWALNNKPPNDKVIT